MLGISRSGKFMLVGDNILCVENLISVDVEEVHGDIASSIEGTDGDSLSEIFSKVERRTSTILTFNVDSGSGRKQIKMPAEQLQAPTNPAVEAIWKLASAL